MAWSETQGKTQAIAVGMARSAGELRPLFGTKGLTSFGARDDLSVKGLPEVREQSLKLKTQLGDWVGVDPVQYFGSESGADGIRHQVWSFKRQSKLAEVTVLLPALALMRALLRPHAYVLAQMFQPQALDSVCRFIDGAPRPTRPWPRARTSAESQPFVGTMTWLHCFPTARQAVSSIYERARDGWLDLELPAATLELHLRGAYRGLEFFATQLTVVSIEPAEEPFPFAEDIPRQLDLRRDMSPTIAGSKLLGLTQGDFRLTDLEWRAVAPLVTSTHARRHSVRDVVDAGLAVQSAAVRSIRAIAGNEATARVYSRQLAHWRENGKWSQIEALVQQMRGAPDGSVACLRRMGPGRTVAVDLPIAHFEPLLEHEWLVLQPLFGKERLAREGQANTTRNIADRIISSLSPGGSWQKSGRYSIGHAACARYRLLVRDGRWVEIVRTLKSLRPLLT